MDDLKESKCPKKDSLCQYFRADKIYIDGSECNGVWEIKGQIGEGASGYVYTGCCSSGEHKDDCKFAIKTSHKGDLLKEVKLQRLAAKAGIAPNIHQVWVSDLEGGSFVMDGLKETLKNRLTAMLSANPNVNVSKIVSQAVKLLVDLHKIGIIHNDSHSSNFMFDSNDKLFLIDFGLAQYIKESEVDIMSDFNTLYKTLGYLNFEIKSKAFGKVIIALKQQLIDYENKLLCEQGNCYNKK